jgi:hypothetical protein
MMKKTLSVCLGIVLLACCETPSALAKDEIQKLTDRLLAVPTIRTEPGFTASVLVKPGHLYDPVWLMAHDGVVWTNDDGGEEGDKGSQIVAISKTGTLSVVVGLGRQLPVTGFGIAPVGFGAFGGQLVSMAQAEVAAPGATKNHIIQRVDLKTTAASTLVCTLPTAGTVHNGISGFGADARFGPANSPFADRFFAATIFNNTIYQVKADGSCTPFVTFDGKPWAEPLGIAFSTDSQRMLVSVAKGTTLSASAKAEGAIVSVATDGTIDPKPVAEGFARPTGITRAPASFGAYAGQLFITDAGKMEIPVPMTQTLAADGKVYRVTAEGAVQLVASGFVNPTGIEFVDNALWVSDINGDFIAGKRELPDGFIVKISPR